LDAFEHQEPAGCSSSHSVNQQAPKSSVSLYLALTITFPAAAISSSVFHQTGALIQSKVQHQPFSLVLHISNSKNSSTRDLRVVCL
jgi:hypothetical protein